MGSGGPFPAHICVSQVGEKIKSVQQNARKRECRGYIRVNLKNRPEFAECKAKKGQMHLGNPSLLQKKKDKRGSVQRLDQLTPCTHGSGEIDLACIYGKSYNIEGLHQTCAHILFCGLGKTYQSFATGLCQAPTLG